MNPLVKRSTKGSGLSWSELDGNWSEIENAINNFTGGLNYIGTWDANTNTPTLQSSVGVKGNYYKVSVDGATSINGITDWKVSDLILFNGTTWDKIDNTDKVLTVCGRIGNVTISIADVANLQSTIDSLNARVPFPGFGITDSTACAGNDPRLSDPRPASDVSAWAKAGTKPTYTATEVGAIANPMTSEDDLIIGGASGVPTRLSKGLEGQIPTIVSGHVAWTTPTTSFTNPMSSQDDLIIGGVDGILTRLGKGTEGQIMTISGGHVGWTDDSGYTSTSPLTGYSVGSNVPLAATDTIPGAFGKVQGQLTAKVSFPGFGTSGSTACVGNDSRLSDPRPASDVSAWAKAGTKPTYTATEVGAFANPMTAQDDIIIGGVSGVPAKLTKGTEGQVPTIVGGHVVWTTPTSSLSNPMTTLGDIIVAGASGVPTRKPIGTDGTLLGVSGGSVGYFTPATFGISSGGGQGFAVITGMDPTGATDSTAAVEAAIAALPAGGGVLLIPDPAGQGGYKMNVTISKSGVWLYGPGLSDNTGNNWIRPWDNTKPVVKFGSAAGNVMVRHCGIRDMYIYGGNVGKYGVTFASGAHYCRAFNINVRNFNGAHVSFINDTDLQPTEFNLLTAFSIESSATIADNADGEYPIGLLFEDRHVSGAGWTTANYVNDGNINVGNGYSYVVESAAASLTNIYIDQDACHGIMIKKSYYYEPALVTNNVITDTGGPTYSVAMILDFGYDLKDNGSTNHISFMGGLNPDMSMGDNVFYAAGHTTGTITSGQNTLTVASLTGIDASRGLIIKGAGTSGKNLYATITNISGLVITLSTNALTSVTSADVMYGNSTNEKAFIGYGGNAYLSPGGLRLIPTGKTGVESRGEKGQFYRCGASGTAAPFNTTDFAFDFKNGSGIHFLHDLTGGTSVSSITQSGTTVTVTTGSVHSAMIGDLITLNGVREQGINGTYTITSVPNTTSVTYTSAISQTLAGITGTPVAIFTNSVRITNGQVVLSGYSGLAIKNQLGNISKVLYQSLSSGAMYIQASDPVNGSISNIAGTGVGTGTAYAWQANNTTKMRLLGDATLQLKPGAAPANDASYGQLYYSSADNKWHIKDIANNDGTVLSTSRAVITATTAAPTATSSTTSVMMGCAGTITPIQTNRLKVTICGQMKNSVAGSGVTVDLRYGSGTKPANADAVSGTVIGIEQTTVSTTAGQSAGFTIVGHVTGLTLGTAYWLDASVKAVTSGSASITGITICAEEV